MFSECVLFSKNQNVVKMLFSLTRGAINHKTNVQIEGMSLLSSALVNQHDVVQKKMKS